MTDEFRENLEIHVEKEVSRAGEILKVEAEEDAENPRSGCRWFCPNDHNLGKKLRRLFLDIVTHRIGYTVFFFFFALS